MKIHSLLKSGKNHSNNGEDFQYHEILGERWLVAAVMDGCSSGTDSIFAAVAYSKSLKKSSKMLPNMKEIFPELDLEVMEKEAVGKFYLKHLFEDIKKLKKLFYLGFEEILSTIIILVYDLKNNSGWVNISGDGFVICNGNTEAVDHQNVPDFMGYHLEKNFNDWFQNHTVSFSYENINDISISTDGIQKLARAVTSKTSQFDPIDFLLIQNLESNKENPLEEKYEQLVQNEEFIPIDDISIIRVIA